MSTSRELPSSLDCRRHRYKKYYDALSATLAAEFGDDITVEPIHDAGTTGNFEVTVGDKLVHSKTTMGHDRCENATSTQKVIDAVQEAVDEA